MPPRRRLRNQEAESHNENKQEGHVDPMQQFVNLLREALNRTLTEVPVDPIVGRVANFKDLIA